jgi:hypothetical protein
VTARVINRLREEPSVRLLPRDTVQGALSGAKVEAHGLLDPADAQKVVQALGANDVVMGQVTQFNWEQPQRVGALAEQLAALPRSRRARWAGGKPRRSARPPRRGSWFVGGGGNHRGSALILYLDANGLVKLYGITRA